MCSQKYLPSVPEEFARPFGIVARLRVEQQARRFERRRREHDDLRLEVVDLARDAVDDAHAGHLVRPLVVEDFGDRRVRPQLEVAGVARREDQRGRRMERRADVASAPAAAASHAALAVLVQHAVGGDAGAPGNQLAAHLRDRALQQHFAFVQLQRPLIEAVRQMRNAFLRAADAEQRVDLVVIRRDVGIADRPVFAEAVLRLPLEIHLGEPQRHAAPHVRLAAKHARPHPGVRRARGRVLLLVDDVVRRIAIARVGVDLLVLPPSLWWRRTAGRACCIRRRSARVRTARGVRASACRTATPSS